MRIVVATTEPDSPAARALRMEGFDVEESCHEPVRGYPALFSDLWNAGDTFITVEHDIIPWPGAIDGLISCPEPWCTHRFPNGGNLMLSFGIGRYTPIGKAPPEWSDWEGKMLDGAVLPYLHALHGAPHVHEPPVAHARAITEGAIHRV